MQLFRNRRQEESKINTSGLRSSSGVVNTNLNSKNESYLQFCMHVRPEKTLKLPCSDGKKIQVSDFSYFLISDSHFFR